MFIYLLCSFHLSIMNAAHLLLGECAHWSLLLLIRFSKNLPLMFQPALTVSNLDRTNDAKRNKIDDAQFLLLNKKGKVSFGKSHKNHLVGMKKEVKSRKMRSESILQSTYLRFLSASVHFKADPKAPFEFFSKHPWDFTCFS